MKPPTSLGTFLSRFGCVATHPVVADCIPHGSGRESPADIANSRWAPPSPGPDDPPGSGQPRRLSDGPLKELPGRRLGTQQVSLRIDPVYDAPVSAAFLYWGWGARIIRPGHDLVRVHAEGRSKSVGGQAVGRRCDPSTGEVDLVVYRADITTELQQTCVRSTLHRQGLEVDGLRPIAGEFLQDPTLVVLFERDDCSVTWLYDGASAMGIGTNLPFTGQCPPLNRDIEYVLANPSCLLPRTTAQWISVNYLGPAAPRASLPARQHSRWGHSAPAWTPQVAVRQREVTNSLGISDDQAQLAIAAHHRATPQGSTFTTLFDLLWIH